LFIALNLPESLRRALWDVVAPLRNLELPLRWVGPDGLHLTLKFLGEVADDREPELIEALRRAAGAGPEPHPFSITLRGFGGFPDVRRPRVLWVGIEPEPALELLQDRVERQFATLGFSTEARPFRPHLTLARAERDARSAGFAALPQALDQLQFEDTVTIETIDLMQSTLRRSGAVYSPRHLERLS
jgi:2'-5' RNA ligase